MYNYCIEKTSRVILHLKNVACNYCIIPEKNVACNSEEKNGECKFEEKKTTSVILKKKNDECNGKKKTASVYCHGPSRPSRFRPKNHSYLRKMSILPDCRVFDYSANFSTHDSTVPNKTPRGIPMVLCVRSSVRDCGRVSLYYMQAHSRTQSPSYARSTERDKGLWPNPYQTGI